MLGARRELGAYQVHPHLHVTSGKTRLKEWPLAEAGAGPEDGAGRMATDKLCHALYTALRTLSHQQPRRMKNPSLEARGTGSKQE